MRVELDGCETLEDYLWKIGQKRRRNLRQERALFAKEGGAMEVIPPPQAPALLADLHLILLASSAHNPDLEIPYEDLIDSKPAFATQKMWVIVARVEEELNPPRAAATCTKPGARGVQGSTPPSGVSAMM